MRSQRWRERHRGRPWWIRASVVAAVMPFLVVVPPASFASPPNPTPVSPEVSSFPVDDLVAAVGTEDEARMFTTAPVKIGHAVVGGVSWAAGPRPTSAEIEFRTRGNHGWSPWQELPSTQEHAPDPGSVEADESRSGTDPLVVDGAEAIQVRVGTTGRRLPRDLRLQLVDPGSSPADASAGVGIGSAAAAAPARPTIYTRAQWGADETLREQGPPKYGQVRGAFVHHTAGTNNYSPSEVPAIIRGIYAYHVNVRGWRDIGYNFLVDRFGRIWEGRYGGIGQAVIGAHTAGYNSYAFAMSVLGTSTAKEPEAAVIKAYQKLFAWKFSLHRVVPSVSVPYPGGKNLQPVAGHRNAAATECPGALLYDKIPSIRAGTTTLMGNVPATRQSRITVAGPTSAPDGTPINLPVWWAAGGWVTGSADLQRWNDGSWQYFKKVKIINGRGTVRTVLDKTTTYRVYGRYAPGVILPTSAAITVKAE